MYNQFIALVTVLFAVMALTVTPAFGDSHAAIQLAQADDGGDDDGGDDDGGDDDADDNGEAGVGGDDDADDNGGAGVGGDDDGGEDTGAAPVRGVQTGAGSTAGLEPALVILLGGLGLATVAGGLRFLRGRA